MPAITKTLYVSDPADWRRWLADNFQTEPEIWLIYPHKDSGKPRIIYNDAVEEALCFGWIDSTVKSYDAHSSVQRFSPRKPGSNWSQTNIERLRVLAKSGQLMPAVAEQTKPLLAQTFVFPKDILAALRANPAAYANFRAGSPVYQRIRVAYVDGARQRPEEFKKRLNSFIKASEAGKQVGYGGIEKYY